MAKTILILGGTAEAEQYAKDVIAQHPDWRVIMSLAGRTKAPQKTPGETRIGGFGGAEGLAQYLRNEQVSQFVDATHPYALQISKNAKIASEQTRIPLTKIERPAWSRKAEDDWILVSGIDAACEALPRNARAFLALGSQYISAFEKRKDCHFTIRMVDPPTAPLPFFAHTVVLGKPPMDAAAERQLFEDNRITHLVTRNSGGTRSYAKIEAARLLKLPVIMIERPKV